ncbi:unnamed protein product [Rotaria sp. Silwood1]|nr:unnamed protein product [Rotaria sp. Silwood1]CAF0905957.1 unnamed protein product [Rotaria sp. Silwood1]CAF3378976.1 unnamed protein product [Rotaria sp. Silwood1]CAF3391979.1 unnamed protein product [Rotaria sp. Silwood1]CAF4678354.1 unnamed protein product [Rotaria sp. Silwood1]
MSYVSTSAMNVTSNSGSTKIHSTQAENVHVHSVVQTETESKVNIENAKKITDLMARLGSTHRQVDEYSRKRTAEISEAVAKSIKKIVAETQEHQQQLLADANLRTAAIEHDCKLKIQEHIAKIDVEKATLLAQLEKELNIRQELILESARQRIDELDEEANRLKMGVLREAQAQTNAKINHIAEQVVALGQEDASHRLASTTTTVITTKAEATNKTHVESTKSTNNSS